MVLSSSFFIPSSFNETQIYPLHFTMTFKHDYKMAKVGQNSLPNPASWETSMITLLYYVIPCSLVENKTWVTNSYLFGFHQKGQELWRHQYQSTTMGTPAFPSFHAATTKSMQLQRVSQLQIASISPQVASLMNNSRLHRLLCETTTSSCSILMFCYTL